MLSWTLQGHVWLWFEAKESITLVHAVRLLQVDVAKQPLDKVSAAGKLIRHFD